MFRLEGEFSGGPAAYAILSAAVHLRTEKRNIKKHEIESEQGVKA